MDKWNEITKQIKMFFDVDPDAPLDIEKTSLDNQKVIMKKYLQPEDDLEVHGLEHKKTHLFSITKQQIF